MFTPARLRPPEQLPWGGGGGWEVPLGWCELIKQPTVDGRQLISAPVCAVNSRAERSTYEQISGYNLSFNLRYIYITFGLSSFIVQKISSNTCTHLQSADGLLTGSVWRRHQPSLLPGADVDWKLHPRLSHRWRSTEKWWDMLKDVVVIKHCERLKGE